MNNKNTASLASSSSSYSSWKRANDVVMMKDLGWCETKKVHTNCIDDTKYVCSFMQEYMLNPLTKDVHSISSSASSASLSLPTLSSSFPLSSSSSSRAYSSLDSFTSQDASLFHDMDELITELKLDTQEELEKLTEDCLLCDEEHWKPVEQMNSQVAREFDFSRIEMTQLYCAGIHRLIRQTMMTSGPLTRFRLQTWCIVQLCTFMTCLGYSQNLDYVASAFGHVGELLSDITSHHRTGKSTFWEYIDTSFGHFLHGALLDNNYEILRWWRDIGQDQYIKWRPDRKLLESITTSEFNEGKMESVHILLGLKDRNYVEKSCIPRCTSSPILKLPRSRL